MINDFLLLTSENETQFSFKANYALVVMYIWPIQIIQLKPLTLVCKK